MSNEPISQRPRVSSIQDADLLLISQKQSDDSYESKSVEASKLKGKDGEPGAKGDPGPISSAYYTQSTLSPDYANNQNSKSSAAGYFLRRQLTPDSFTCHLYYKTRMYIPNIPQNRTPLVTAKLLSIFIYLDQNGNVLEYKDADIYSGSPQFDSASGRWYIDVKVIIPDVIFKPNEASAAKIGLISDVMSIVDNTTAKRLNYSSDLSGFVGVLPALIAGETIIGPKIIITAL
ncbi:hypothetical protein [Acinetobacter guillouiae]|uniref:hypothetical protein n=1 Tax=Acinetobacter guillouiae TaxID=106649 RepID=UPI0032B61BAC